MLSAEHVARRVRALEEIAAPVPVTLCSSVGAIVRRRDSCAHPSDVDCRIEIADLADRRLIRLAGRLTAAQVHELLVASRGAPGVVHLDLRELVSLDAVGLEVLSGLQRDGARLLQVPAYIQLKLDNLSAKRRRRGD
jgi:hypothetical protein